MTDFDFDELDRAVTGSLEGGMEGDDNDGAKDGNDTAVSSSPAMQRTTAGMGGAHPFHAARFEAAPIARYQEGQSQSQSQNQSQGRSQGQWVSNGNDVKTTTASTSAHSPLRASSGRFMDIVHPSSDMRSSGTSKSKFRPPVSHGHTNNNGHADSHGHGHGGKAEAGSASTEHSAVKNATAKSSLDEFAKPLESPFLLDAKVEKRPLGGAGGPLPVSSPASASAPASAVLEFESAPVSSAKTSKPASKQPFTTDLPKEPLLDEPDEPRLEAPGELRLDDGDDSDSNNGNTSTNTNTSASANVNTSTGTNTAGGASLYNGATSIHQQYKEQPSATSAQPGALYDTEAYHQPLQHTEKKHSGFWVIFWILLLVLVGAGIGAAAYFFVIPLI